MEAPQTETFESPPEAENGENYQTFSNGEQKLFRAVLWSVQPIDVVQLACLRHTRTSLFFLTEESETGTIFIDGGRIVHAECQTEQGMRALSTILSWHSGEIQEFTEWVVEVPQTIGLDWQIALMEASQAQDERSEPAA